jgi:5-methylcytosine-specific restriction protein A
MWPFEKGRTYNRREDIHARYGGQQQGGIITPAKAPLVIAITGESGLQHGYADKLRPDGVFEYYGEGQVGPMRFAGGNRAIATHSQNGKSLLLFKKERDRRLRYDGEWVCEAVLERQAPDRTGSLRPAFVFELRPLEAIETAIDTIPPGTADLAALRARALAAASSLPTKTSASTTVFERSRDVRDYVLARSHGICEGCQKPAPFERTNGSPYLEAHHLRRLSDGGPDDPRFVIALCPNCHRRVHVGKDGPGYNSELGTRMEIIERAQ